MVKKKKPVSDEYRSSARIPPHKHCIVCGKAIPEDERFCSEECEAAFKRMQRAKILNFVYMFILVVVLMIILRGMF
ncbi:MAG: DUF2116 family Zn-ribbon domain-containing protein [Thermoplasmata archaeon]|nr:DUF2116 family Zn-ribbon domain-containing protein [Thermoplasmata archaeon]